jgi:hypothetical protein
MTLFMWMWNAAAVLLIVWDYPHLGSYDKFVWRLCYKNVRRLVVDFPTQKPLFCSAGEGFGDSACIA